METGPDRVIACPQCGEPALVQTLYSGNTFGAREWTDGKMVAPMLPEPPLITRCKKCRSFYWLADAKEIGEHTPDNTDKWKDTAYAAQLSEAECLEAINVGAANSKEREAVLRVLAWRAGNDEFRSGWQGADKQDPVGYKRSPEAEKNLEVLLGMLDKSDPSQRLMQAEILRELERFDESLQVLASDFPREYEDIVSFIRSLALEMDSVVRLISP